MKFQLRKQAYRLQQNIHNEITNKLKSIDKFRAIAITDETMTWKISVYKNKIAEMLKILGQLKELLQNISHISIESFLDLLMHKFNVIETECTVNDLLNTDIQKLMSPAHIRSSTFCDITLTDDFSSAYLNDILRRCSELKQEESNKNDDSDDDGHKESIDNFAANDMMRDVWPDIMDRLENYLDHRKQIKVDLKRLTSEEEAMVESIRNECVENIIEDLFQKK